MGRQILPSQPPPHEHPTAKIKGISAGRGTLETPSRQWPRRLPGLRWRILTPREPILPGTAETALAAVLANLMEWAEHAGVEVEGAVTKARRAVVEREGRV